MRRIIKETSRERALTDDEIRLFWLGCDDLGWPFGPMFKLLLLTAQCRREVGGMEWSEIDLTKRLWAIPRHKAKNGRAHMVHLSEAAAAIIDRLPRIGSPPRFVLSTNGERPVSGFSKSKERLDKLMLARLRTELGDNSAVIDPWILHDLRRTATTGMAGLQIPPHVVDKILNHVSGTIHGVAAVYNRHAHLDERKAALEAWARYVENLVRPPPANVVQLGAAR